MLITSMALVTMSPKAPGSESNHAWVPKIVTTSGRPNVLHMSSKERRVTRHSGRPPKGSRISEHARQDFGNDDRQFSSGLTSWEQVGGKVDSPIPQGALGHRTQYRTALGPG